MREINFLESQLRDSLARVKGDKKTLLISVALLAVVVVTWLGLLGYNQYLTSSAEKITTEAGQLETELKATALTQIDYLTFVNKVKDISSIIALRHDGIEKIAVIDEYMTDEDKLIMLQTYEYSMREKTIRTAAVMQNAFVMETFYQKLALPDFRDQFTSIEYGSLSRGIDGRYVTTLTFVLK